MTNKNVFQKPLISLRNSFVFCHRKSNFSMLQLDRSWFFKVILKAAVIFLSIDRILSPISWLGKNIGQDSGVECFKKETIRSYFYKIQELILPKRWNLGYLLHINIHFNMIDSSSSRVSSIFKYFFIDKKLLKLYDYL